MTLNQVLTLAKKKRYAIGHFNTSTFEQMKAIVQASRITRTPVMIGTSEGEVSYLGLERTVALFRQFRRETDIPIFLNLDHAKSFETCQVAIDSGYDSVLFDGSRLPYRENVRLTRKVRDYAKRKNKSLSVEGELGVLPTEASKIYHQKIKIDRTQFTNPFQAQAFVRATRIDRLAPAFGTLHGIQAGGRNPHIDLGLVREIGSALPETFLVMHGGSGTPRSDVKKAIKLGIVNVHISTEIRKLYVDELRKRLKKDEYAPYRTLAPVVAKLTKLIINKIKFFK